MTVFFKIAIRHRVGCHRHMDTHIPRLRTGMTHRGMHSQPPALYDGRLARGDAFLFRKGTCRNAAEGRVPEPETLQDLQIPPPAGSKNPLYGWFCSKINHKVVQRHYQNECVDCTDKVHHPHRK